MGLQLPRHGIRGLSAGWTCTGTLAVRAGRGRHGGQSQPDDILGADARGTIHRRRDARWVSRCEEAHAVAGLRPNRRQSIRRLRTDAGTVPRRHSSGGADARRERRAARRHRHSGYSRHALAERPVRVDDRERATESGEGDRGRRARWATAQGHRQCEADVSRTAGR